MGGSDHEEREDNLIPLRRPLDAEAAPGPGGLGGGRQAPAPNTPQAADGRSSEAVGLSQDDGGRADPSRPRALTYVETSALLTWLLDEPRREEVAALLDTAGDVVTSSLTFLEAQRALVRLAHQGMDPGDVELLAAKLDGLREEWLVMPLDDELLSLAARRFPVEPVRSLDALHLASVCWVKDLHSLQVRFVALDKRVRVNALALGLDVAP